MGCSGERTVEGNKTKNKIYPVCRLTVPLTIELDSLTAISNNKIILGAWRRK